MFLQLPTIEALSVTLIVTVIRTILEASPTILGGVVVAAWLRTLVTPERVRVIFREEGVPGVLRTVLVGMAMPVCSIGVLPVLRELHRLGLPASKLVTLCLVAPLINPISLLYGLTVLSATQILLVVTSVGVLALIIGDVSARFVVTSQVSIEKLPRGLTGATRLRNLFIAAGRIVTGWPLLEMLMVALVTGVITAFIPFGTFSLICETSNPSGPAIASLLTIPQYVGPVRGAIQFATVERAGLAISAGLAIYIFGAGVSAGNFLWLTRWYGWRRVTAMTIAVFLFVCSTAYASGFLFRMPAEMAEETTGLNGLARPSWTTLDKIADAVNESLWFTDPLMIMGAVAFWILVLAGIVVRLMNMAYRNDDPEQETSANPGRMAKAIPASQLGAVAVSGIAILCCLTTYVFFPSPEECLEEMQTIRMDANIAIRGGNIPKAVDRLAALDSVAAKLPVSAAVHFTFPTPTQRQATRDLRLLLHSTRKLLLNGDVAAAQDNIPVLLQLFSSTKESFAGSAS